MESPNYFPNAESAPHQSPKKLDPCLPLDPIDDSENEIRIVDLPDSSLSDEFDFDEENNDSQACDDKTTQDNKAEILKLADTQDPIKENRTIMIKKLTSMGSDYNLKNPVAPKLNEHPICVKESQESVHSDHTDASSNKENISENITVSNTSETKKIEEKLSPKTSNEEINAQENAYIQTIPEFQSKIQKSNAPVLGVQSSNLPVVEGYLKKKTGHFLHPWHARYVALKDHKLLYYKNDAKDRLLGCIDFFLIQVRLEVDRKDSKNFMIAPIGSDKIFTFKAETEVDVRKWISALTLHTKAPDLSNTVLGIAAVRNFWKHDRISEKKFLTESKTGDLVLFRGGSLAGRIQRSVTRSEYDHVGLILKYSDGDIVLLEASANQGVGVCRWSMFMRNNWHLLYEKIVYRKLSVERTRDMIEKTEKFVRSVVGKKYSITAKKLLWKKSTSIGVETPNDRTFFCSELVAACYKRMELLPKEVSSAQYLPVSFSADKKLPLLKGAKLGDELLIDFNM